MHVRQSSLALALVAMLALAASLIAAAPPPQEGEEGTAEIIAPQEGDAVRGVVQIVGTALHPDFNHYTLEFGFDPNVDDQWFPVQDPVAQQVQNGPLAVWDTTVVADGLYQLRLRVVRNDGAFDEAVVAGIEVKNAVPTQLPTILPSSTPTVVQGTPTIGPSPTSPIQQPPTNTPRPTPTPGGPTLTPTPNPNAALTRQQFRAAVCRGTGLTVVFFVLLGGYVLARRYARADIRRWWLRFRREVLDNLFSRSGRGG